MSNRFANGAKAFGFCDVCGFRFDLKKLKNLVVKTKQTQIKACPQCWTPDQPQLQLGMYPISDPQALRDPRPDTNTWYQSGTNGLQVDPTSGTGPLQDGFPGEGNRVIEWGWAPIGGASSFDTALTPNALIGVGLTGQLTTASSNILKSAIYTAPGTYSWVAPGGVSEVIVICIGGGGSSYESSPAGNGVSGGTSSFASLLNATGGGAGILFGAGGAGGAGTSLSASVFGGNGGSGGSIDASVIGLQYVDLQDSAASPVDTFYAINSIDSGNNTDWNFNADSVPSGAGAGAGGYYGIGGNGADGNAVSVAGSAGQGGAGGGGGSYVNGVINFAGGGGGVGPYGQGGNGAGGTTDILSLNGKGGSNGANGTLVNTAPYSGNNGGLYGGGGGAPQSIGGGGGGGGGLRWSTLAVTPGNAYTVTVGAGGQVTEGGDGANGAVAIWYLSMAVSVNQSVMPIALLNAAANNQPEKTLFKDTLIGGRPLGDINNSGTVTSADSLAYSRFNTGTPQPAAFNEYINNVLNPYMLANSTTYSAYLIFS